MLNRTFFCWLAQLFALWSCCAPTDAIVVDPSLDGWQAGSGSNFGTSTQRWFFSE